MTDSSTPRAPVGTAVHYVNYSGVCRAATVTEIYGNADEADDGRRNLRIQHAAELADRTAVPWAPRRAGETWHAFSDEGCHLR